MKVILGKLWLFLSLLLMSTAYAATLPIDKGLVGYWKFDGNVQDSSSYSNHGTAAGDFSYTKNRFNKENTAGAFNGQNTYIQVPHSSSLAPTNQWTIAVWAKGIPNDSYNFVPFVSKGREEGGCGAYREYLFGGYADGSLHAPFAGEDNGCQEFIEARTNVDSNSWHHYAVTVDRRYFPGKMTLYVDGVQKATVASWYSHFNSTWEDVYIGGAPATTWQYWKGGLDDIRIYNRALPQDEIAMLADESKYPIIYMYAPKGGITYKYARTTTFKWAMVNNAAKYQINVKPDGWYGHYVFTVNTKNCDTKTKVCTVSPSNVYLPTTGNVSVRIYAYNAKGQELARSVRSTFDVDNMTLGVGAPVDDSDGNELIDGRVIGQCLFGGYCARGTTTQAHNGLDVMLDKTTPVKAICDGKVMVARGKAVAIANRFTIIKHTQCGGLGELYSYYGHIDTSVKVGQTVYAGDTVGTVADWGTNSHLHFGLNKKYVSSGWGYVDIGQTTSRACTSREVSIRQNGLTVQGWLDPAVFGAAVGWKAFLLEGGSNSCVAPSMSYTQYPAGKNLPYYPWSY